MTCTLITAQVMPAMRHAYATVMTGSLMHNKSTAAFDGGKQTNNSIDMLFSAYLMNGKAEEMVLQAEKHAQVDTSKDCSASTNSMT